MHQRTRSVIRTDPRAVSPVIGVVMMVAITVILTGVIATFVLGMGTDTQLPPQASLELSTNDSEWLHIEHDGGQAIELDALYLRGDASVDDSLAGLIVEEQTRLRGGETVSLRLTDHAAPTAGDTIALVWDVDSDAATIAEFRWPDA